MMKRMSLVFWFAVVFVIAAQPAPIPTITVLPSSGNVSGIPGAVVGWGFALTYTAPADWVVLTGSQFTGSPIYGTYVDYLSLSNAPLYVAGASPESSVVTEAWNAKSNPPLGLGEFDLFANAPYGVDYGSLIVHYSVFSQDPNSPTFDPDTSTVVADATVSVPVSVNVTPEPASFLLIFTALLPLALVRYRRCWHVVLRCLTPRKTRRVESISAVNAITGTPTAEVRTGSSQLRAFARNGKPRTP